MNDPLPPPSPKLAQDLEDLAAMHAHEGFSLYFREAAARIQELEARVAQLEGKPHSMPPVRRYNRDELARAEMSVSEKGPEVSPIRRRGIHAAPPAPAPAAAGRKKVVMGGFFD